MNNINYGGGRESKAPYESNAADKILRRIPTVDKCRKCVNERIVNIT